MKKRDIQELAAKEGKELKALLKEKHETLFGAKLDHATGKLKNTRSLATLRDDIARIKTVLKQKEVHNGKTT